MLNCNVYKTEKSTKTLPELRSTRSCSESEHLNNINELKGEANNESPYALTSLLKEINKRFATTPCYAVILIKVSSILN